MSGVLCGFFSSVLNRDFLSAMLFMCPPVAKVCIDARSYSSGHATLYDHDILLRYAYAECTDVNT